MSTSRLGKYLVEDGRLTEADRRTIDRTSGNLSFSFIKSIITLGLFTEESLEQYLLSRTPFTSAGDIQVSTPSPQAIAKIDLPLLRHLEVIPLELSDKEMVVAVPDPLDHGTIRQLEFFTGLKIHPKITRLSTVSRVLGHIIKNFSPRTSPLEAFLKKHAHTPSDLAAVAKMSRARDLDREVRQVLPNWSERSRDNANIPESRLPDEIHSTDEFEDFGSGGSGSDFLDSDLGHNSVDDDELPPPPRGSEEPDLEHAELALSDVDDNTNFDHIDKALGVSASSQHAASTSSPAPELSADVEDEELSSSASDDDFFASSGLEASGDLWETESKGEADQTSDFGDTGVRENSDDSGKNTELSAMPWSADGPISEDSESLGEDSFTAEEKTSPIIDDLDDSFLASAEPADSPQQAENDVALLGDFQQEDDQILTAKEGNSGDEWDATNTGSSMDSSTLELSDPLPADVEMTSKMDDDLLDFDGALEHNDEKAIPDVDLADHDELVGSSPWAPSIASFNHGLLQLTMGSKGQDLTAVMEKTFVQSQSTAGQIITQDHAGEIENLACWRDGVGLQGTTLAASWSNLLRQKTGQMDSPYLVLDQAEVPAAWKAAAKYWTMFVSLRRSGRCIAFVGTTTSLAGQEAMLAAIQSLMDRAAKAL